MGGSGESCLVVTLMMYLSVSQIQPACVDKKKVIGCQCSQRTAATNH